MNEGKLTRLFKFWQFPNFFQDLQSIGEWFVALDTNVSESQTVLISQTGSWSTKRHRCWIFKLRLWYWPSNASGPNPVRHATQLGKFIRPLSKAFYPWTFNSHRHVCVTDNQQRLCVNLLKFGFLGNCRRVQNLLSTAFHGRTSNCSGSGTWSRNLPSKFVSSRWEHFFWTYDFKVISIF